MLTLCSQMWWIEIMDDGDLTIWHLAVFLVITRARNKPSRITEKAPTRDVNTKIIKDRRVISIDSWSCLLVMILALASQPGKAEKAIAGGLLRDCEIFAKVRCEL